jgi:hypothetical protein
MSVGSDRTPVTGAPGVVQRNACNSLWAIAMHLTPCGCNNLREKEVILNLTNDDRRIVGPRHNSVKVDQVAKIVDSGGNLRYSRESFV